MEHPYDTICDVIDQIRNKISQDHELLTHRYPAQERMTHDEVDDMDYDLYRAIDLLNKAKNLVEEHIF